METNWAYIRDLLLQVEEAPITNWNINSKELYLEPLLKTEGLKKYRYEELKLTIPRAVKIGLLKASPNGDGSYRVDDLSEYGREFLSCIKNLDFFNKVLKEITEEEIEPTAERIYKVAKKKIDEKLGLGD